MQVPVIERERACLPDLHWRVGLPEGGSVDKIEARLRALGAIDRSPNTLVRLFTLPSGDRVVLVPKTGRIQLRLDASSEARARPAMARALALALLEPAA